jgi:hypothetical protein
MVVRLSALCASRPLHPGRFLALISITGWVNPSAAGRIRLIEKSYSLIRNWIHDLPACSIVPQPTKIPFSTFCTNLHWADWCRGNAPDLSLGYDWFEYFLHCQLSWVKNLCFPCFSRKLCDNIYMIAPLKILTYSSSASIIVFHLMLSNLCSWNRIIN